MSILHCFDYGEGWFGFELANPHRRKQTWILHSDMIPTDKNFASGQGDKWMISYQSVFCVSFWCPFEFHSARFFTPKLWHVVSCLMVTASPPTTSHQFSAHWINSSKSSADKMLLQEVPVHGDELSSEITALYRWHLHLQHVESGFSNWCPLLQSGLATYAFIKVVI